MLTAEDIYIPTSCGLDVWNSESIFILLNLSYFLNLSSV